MKEEFIQQMIISAAMQDYSALLKKGFPGPAQPVIHSEVHLGKAGRADIVITGFNEQENLVVWVYELKRRSVGFKDLRQITEYMAAVRNWLARKTGLPRESEDLNDRVVGVLIGTSIDREMTYYASGKIRFVEVDPCPNHGLSFEDYSEIGLTESKVDGLYAILADPRELAS